MVMKNRHSGMDTLERPLNLTRRSDAHSSVNGLNGSRWSMVEYHGLG